MGVFSTAGGKKVQIRQNELAAKSFRSAMLLPSCAFVLWNVNLCFPRLSHKSAHAASHRPSVLSVTGGIRVLQAFTDTSTISVSACLLLSLSVVQHLVMNLLQWL